MRLVGMYSLASPSSSELKSSNDRKTDAIEKARVLAAVSFFKKCGGMIVREVLPRDLTDEGVSLRQPS